MSELSKAAPLEVLPTGTALVSRRPFFIGVATAALLGLAGCSSSSSSDSDSGAEVSANDQPDATIEMKQVQAAFMASAGGGHGTLNYKGQSHPFDVGGLGIGGIGASTIDATGDVYHMASLTDFPGTYVQGRYGAVLGTMSAGDLWLKNSNGVVLHLKAKRTGLMLSLGGDAVVIKMTESGS